LRRIAPIDIVRGFVMVDPYRNLFHQTERTRAAVAAALREKQEVLRGQQGALKPLVVCGTLIVPANPEIDAKIRVATPSVSLSSKVKTVNPPICRPE
jgi:hypothetical protein